MTVVKVNGLRTPGQRATVCYVGRAFAGWPGSPWCNPYRPRRSGCDGFGSQWSDPGESVADCLSRFRAYALAKPDAWWSDLWAACRGGGLSLGCWCAQGSAEATAPHCHAGILACELNRRFAAPTEGAES